MLRPARLPPTISLPSHDGARAAPRIISILTAAFGPKADYLPETAASIRTIPIHDDVSMCTAAAAIAGGIYLEDTIWLYRIHENQTHNDASLSVRAGLGQRIAS